MFHVGASSEPILCSCPGVLDSSCDDKTGPHPTCPLPGTLTPRSLQWQLSVASASSRPTLPSAGTSSPSMVANAPPSFAHLNVSRSVCDGVRTLTVVMLDSLVRPCQHKNNTTILPTPRQRLPFRYQ